MAEESQDNNIQESNTLKDYLRLLRLNWIPVTLITFAGLPAIITFPSGNE